LKIEIQYDEPDSYGDYTGDAGLYTQAGLEKPAVDCLLGRSVDHFEGAEALLSAMLNDVIDRAEDSLIDPAIEILMGDANYNILWQELLLLASELGVSLHEVVADRYDDYLNAVDGVVSELCDKLTVMSQRALGAFLVEYVDEAEIAVLVQADSDDPDVMGEAAVEFQRAIDVLKGDYWVRATTSVSLADVWAALLDSDSDFDFDLDFLEEWVNEYIACGAPMPPRVEALVIRCVNSGMVETSNTYVSACYQSSESEGYDDSRRVTGVYIYRNAVLTRRRADAQEAYQITPTTVTLDHMQHPEAMTVEPLYLPSTGMRPVYFFKAHGHEIALAELPAVIISGAVMSLHTARGLLGFDAEVFIPASASSMPRIERDAAGRVASTT
jgi:AcrR family transcriptional regulator